MVDMTLMMTDMLLMAGTSSMMAGKLSLMMVDTLWMAGKQSDYLMPDLKVFAYLIAVQLESGCSSIDLKMAENMSIGLKLAVNMNIVSKKAESTSIVLKKAEQLKDFELCIGNLLEVLYIDYWQEQSIAMLVVGHMLLMDNLHNHPLQCITYH